MRVIFFGTPEFAVPSLKALLESGEEVVAVVTQPDKVKGRGHMLSQPPVKEEALLRGIPVLQPAGIRSDSFLNEISGLAPDVIAVVAYGRIIPPSLLSLPPLGCINVHASLLPKYRGAAPIQWAIITGETRTGVTTMLMDEGLDTGPMLLREETEISDEDTSQSLGMRLSHIGACLLVKTLVGIKDRSVNPVPQPDGESFAPPLKKEDGRIDWSWDAKKISDRIRGTYPWPGAYCFINGERITITKASVIDTGFQGAPGRISKVAGAAFYVETGKGVLSVSGVKPEGKKMMPAASFLNGRRLKEGARFDNL